VLLDEHRTIEGMVEVLEAMAARLERGAALPDGMVDEVLDFFQGFCDVNHHVKEEELLFPALARRGAAVDATPINAYVAQHEIARGYMRELRGLAGELRRAATARAAFAATAREYVSLMREHIRIEDHYFSEMAEQVLTPQEDATLAAGMSASGAGLQSGERERYLRMVGRYRDLVAQW